MPAFKTSGAIEVTAGMKCDSCGKVDKDGFNEFEIDHVLGCDGPRDMATVKAAVCDACLVAIVVERLPGAVILSADGHPVTTADVRMDLARFAERPPASPVLAARGARAAWAGQVFQGSPLAPFTIGERFVNDDGETIGFTVTDRNDELLLALACDFDKDLDRTSHILLPMSSRHLLPALDQDNGGLDLFEMACLAVEDGASATEIQTLGDSSVVATGQRALPAGTALRLLGAKPSRIRAAGGDLNAPYRGSHRGVACGMIERPSMLQVARLNSRLWSVIWQPGRNPAILTRKEMLVDFEFMDRAPAIDVGESVRVPRKKQASVPWFVGCSLGGLRLTEALTWHGDLVHAFTATTWDDKPYLVLRAGAGQLPHCSSYVAIAIPDYLVDVLGQVRNRDVLDGLARLAIDAGMPAIEIEVVGNDRNLSARGERVLNAVEARNAIGFTVLLGPTMTEWSEEPVACQC